jgi:hypothetical protein
MAKIAPFAGAFCDLVHTRVDQRRERSARFGQPKNYSAAALDNEALGF